MPNRIVAIIPARGGSVRVTKKNIRLLHGKPLIYYAIQAAKATHAIDRIIVSTDDEEIKEVALKYGAEVPFIRPPEFCGDCPTEDVVIHAITWLGEHEMYYPTIVVCLEPPQPFRTAKHITRCLDEFKDWEMDSVVTVSPVSERPEWMVRLAEDCRIKPYTHYFGEAPHPLLKFPASQEFEPLYYVNGIVFACRTKVLFEYRSLVGRYCVGVVTEREDNFSLDWPIDFGVCELLMKERE